MNPHYIPADSVMGGYPKFVSQGLNDDYLPLWLQEAGYNTYYTGKLMNNLGIHTYQSPPPRGWTRSHCTMNKTQI